jgi:hypothetical protein
VCYVKHNKSCCVFFLEQNSRNKVDLVPSTKRSFHNSYVLGWVWFKVEKYPAPPYPPPAHTRTRKHAPTRADSREKNAPPPFTHKATFLPRSAVFGICWRLSLRRWRAWGREGGSIERQSQFDLRWPLTRTCRVTCCNQLGLYTVDR